MLKAQSKTFSDTIFLLRAKDGPKHSPYRIMLVIMNSWVLFQKQESGLTDTYLNHKTRKDLIKQKVSSELIMYQTKGDNIFFNIGRLTLFMIRYCIATYESFITAKTQRPQRHKFFQSCRRVVLISRSRKVMFWCVKLSSGAGTRWRLMLGRMCLVEWSM